MKIKIKFVKLEEYLKKKVLQDAHRYLLITLLCMCLMQIEQFNYIRC
jgi:hypothetical protein